MTPQTQNPKEENRLPASLIGPCPRCGRQATKFGITCDGHFFETMHCPHCKDVCLKPIQRRQSYATRRSQ